MDFKFIIMKKLILVSFLFISIAVYSQGNLQFNRVINLEYSQRLNGISSNNTGETGETLLESITLEENKVWKVVSAAISQGDRLRGDTPLSAGGAISLFINKTLIYRGSFNYMVTPIWISSGTKNIIAYNPSTNASLDPYIISLSIIEFNIVP